MKTRKRLLTLALALALCLGLFPAAARAAEEGEWALGPIVYDDSHKDQVAWNDKRTYEDLSMDDRLMAVRRGGKWGFLDIATGQEAIPCQYDSVGDFSEGLAAVWRIGQGWGYIDLFGTQVVPCKYSEAKPFHESRAAVSTGEYPGKKWGFVDMAGGEAVACQYTKVEDFSGGFAKAEGRSGTLYVDAFGNECVIPLLRELPWETQKEIDRRYLDIRPFGDTAALVRNGQKYGLVDKTGQEIVPCRYDKIEKFHDGMAAVKLGDKYGYINELGQEVIPCTYDRALEFSEGLAAVSIAAQGSGYVDKAGNLVVPCIYDGTFTFADGLGRFTSHGNFGYVDHSGNVLVPCNYRDYSVEPRRQGDRLLLNGDYVDLQTMTFHPHPKEDVKTVRSTLSDGLIRVGKGPEVYYQDESGQVVLRMDRYAYGQLGDFHDGLASVHSGLRYGYIDKTGQVAIEVKYTSAGDFDQGYARVSRKEIIADEKWIQAFLNMGGSLDDPSPTMLGPNRYGVIDRTGREAAPCRYDKVGPIARGFAAVAVKDQDGKTERWGIVDLVAGQEVVPCLYDRIDCVRKGFFQVWQGERFGVFGPGAGAQQPVPTQSTADLAGLDPALGFRLEGTVLVGYAGPGGEVTVPDGVTELGPDAFRDCTALTGLTLPDSVVKIHKTALAGCTYLARLTLPDGVELSEDMEELDDCVRLREITYSRLSERVKFNMKRYNQWVNPGSCLANIRGNAGRSDVAVLSDQIVADAGAVTDYEKLQAICVWVASNIDYDYTFTHWSKSSSTILRDRLAVCQGYAALTWDLVEAQGIPCFHVVDSSGQGHEWNHAFADGRWVMLDTTWMVMTQDGQRTADLDQFDMSLPYISMLSDHMFNGYPSAAEADTPSAWARAETWSAISAYLVPYDLQKDYRANITREEFCRLAVRLVEARTGQSAADYAAGRGLAVTDPFTDTDSPEVLTAYALGIVTGTSETTFTPQGSITRQEAAAMLARTAKLLGLTALSGETFADAAAIASWADDSVAFVSGLCDPTTGNKVMGGVGDGRFDPAGTYTREQAYMTVARLFHAVK